MDTHMENSVGAAIAHSLRGPARELVGFIGYSVDLNLILSEVGNHFGKSIVGINSSRSFIRSSKIKGRKLGLLQVG